jgi:hypothetical protein
MSASPTGPRKGRKRTARAAASDSPAAADPAAADPAAADPAAADPAAADPAAADPAAADPAAADPAAAEPAQPAHRGKRARPGAAPGESSGPRAPGAAAGVLAAVYRCCTCGQCHEAGRPCGCGAPASDAPRWLAQDPLLLCGLAVPPDLAAIVRAFLPEGEAPPRTAFAHLAHALLPAPPPAAAADRVADGSASAPAGLLDGAGHAPVPGMPPAALQLRDWVWSHGRIDPDLAAALRERETQLGEAAAGRTWALAVRAHGGVQRLGDADAAWGAHAAAFVAWCARRAVALPSWDAPRGGYLRRFWRAKWRAPLVVFFMGVCDSRAQLLLHGVLEDERASDRAGDQHAHRGIVATATRNHLWALRPAAEADGRGGDLDRVMLAVALGLPFMDARGVPLHAPLAAGLRQRLADAMRGHRAAVLDALAHADAPASSGDPL